MTRNHTLPLNIIHALGAHGAAPGAGTLPTLRLSRPAAHHIDAPAGPIGKTSQPVLAAIAPAGTRRIAPIFAAPSQCLFHPRLGESGEEGEGTDISHRSSIRLTNAAERLRRGEGEASRSVKSSSSFSFAIESAVSRSSRSRSSDGGKMDGKGLILAMEVCCKRMRRDEACRRRTWRLRCCLAGGWGGFRISAPVSCAGI